MMKRWIVLSIPLVLLALGLIPAHAANIHMHYFESADVILEEGDFQIFSVAVVAGEKVTVVAYALNDEAPAAPVISVITPFGYTIREDLNDDVVNGEPAPRPVAYVEFEAGDSGLYTFVVSTKSGTSGSVRVMVVEGDPLEPDRSLLDTIDPLLPSRAFIVAGDSEEPIRMSVTLLNEESPELGELGIILDAQNELTEIFASRGNQHEVPPLTERTEGIEQNSWENANGDIFYILNVSPRPDLLPQAGKEAGLLSYRTQTIENSLYRIDLGNGGELEFVPRQVCQAFAKGGAAFFSGPGTRYIFRGNFETDTPIELLGENGRWYAFVDLTQESGVSWVLKTEVTLPEDLDPEACDRVEFFGAAPPPGQDEEEEEGDGYGFNYDIIAERTSQHQTVLLASGSILFLGLVVARLRAKSRKQA
jgi:hypothetical protein